MTFLQRHAYDIGGALAAVVWPFLGRRRRIAVDNILRAKITDDPKEARRIAKRSLCHLAGHIGEALFVPSVVTRANYREHLDTSCVSDVNVKLLLDSPGQPILLVSSHHGVWEAATNVLSFARPMIAIARVQNNRLVAKWMKKYHFRGPVTIVDKNHGFTPAVLEQWQRDGAAMTILMDQHAGRGAPLTFFGRPARTYTTAARLAMRTGCPIVVGSFVRVAPYRYRLVASGDPIVLSKEDDRNAATQLLNDRLEAAIRQYPEQYLWLHRRWRDD